MVFEYQSLIYKVNVKTAPYTTGILMDTQRRILLTLEDFVILKDKKGSC